MNAAGFHITPAFTERLGGAWPWFFFLDPFPEGMHQFKQQRAITLWRLLDFGMQLLCYLIGFGIHNHHSSSFTYSDQRINQRTQLSGVNQGTFPGINSVVLSGLH